jgi:eukaryotic-like serine/threonine-protein kinase
MTTSTPCPDPARWRALLDGTLPEDVQEALQGHLETCTSCQEALEGLAADREAWRGAARHLGETPPRDAALRQAIAALKGRASPTDTQPTEAPPEPPALDFLRPPEKLGQLGRLGGYEILDVLGRGGFGVVLKAFDPSLHRVVAIKVLAPALASSATARRRFTREAQAAAAVSHDHVVAIHAVEEANDPPYLVMQYVAGVSLQERLDRAGPLELKEILRIGMQAAHGLAAAHAQGLVHRDVKPANILLENGVQRVKLTDFGLARAVDDASLTQSGVVAGTPQYMAPEQALGEAVDHRADLFSLGSVLYALCTGRPPFRAGAAVAVLKRVCEEEPQPIRALNPDVPDWLCAIIAKLHAKNPADRFQSAAEVAELLGRYLAHLQQPGQVPLPPPVPDLSARARGWRRGLHWAVEHRNVVVPLGVFLLFCGYWFGPPLYRALFTGTLAVASDAPDVQVAVWQGNQLIAVLLARPSQEVRLPPGTYDLQVVGDPPPPVEYLSVQRFHFFSFSWEAERPNGRWRLELGRGERVVVTVEVAKKPTTQEPAPGPTTVDARQQQAQGAARLNRPVVESNRLGMKLALIPPGEFWMGASDAEVEQLGRHKTLEPGTWYFLPWLAERVWAETPRHRVKLTQPFYLGIHEVTVGQFRKFVEETKYVTGKGWTVPGGVGWGNGRWEKKSEFDWSNPGFQQTDEHPVSNISWDDAVAFCRWLSDKEGFPYRLPTEAEWEYACRAGTTTRYSNGDADESLREVANLADASLRARFPTVEWAVPWNDGYAFTAPVGRFRPNAWGLYDMLGNACEWCQDWYDKDYYARSPPRDPAGPPQGKQRVFRGGSWDTYPGFCRCADRYSSHSLTLYTEWAGFRVVRALPEVAPAD